MDLRPLQLDTTLVEIVKLQRVRAIGLPNGLSRLSERFVKGTSPSASEDSVAVIVEASFALSTARPRKIGSGVRRRCRHLRGGSDGPRRHR